jgi:acyl transferase domain-containing protein
VGSVKTNIGHSEGVAGVAGMMKAVLSIQNKIIPKNLHFNTPNELIDWKNLPIEVPVENTPWDSEHQYIGVSGFGVTGTNGHVILGAAPKVEEKTFEKALRKDVFVLPLSAKTIESLQALANKYAQFITESEDKLEDICAMAALKRSTFEVRKVFVALDKEQLIEQLSDFSELSVEESKNYDADDTVKVVFVCPGQGAQWIGMAQQLYESEIVFKKSLDECAQAYSKVVSWDLIQELKGNRFNEIDIIQPVIVSIEIALGQLWKSKGIQPDIVVGHSMGEVAAAYLAEMISIDDAALIICTRSALMKQNSGKGAMMVTDLTLEEAQLKISGQEATLSVAVQNSPNSTVIAGDPTQLQELVNNLMQKEDSVE